MSRQKALLTRPWQGGRLSLCDRRSGSAAQPRAAVFELFAHSVGSSCRVLYDLRGVGIASAAGENCLHGDGFRWPSTTTSPVRPRRACRRSPGRALRWPTTAYRTVALEPAPAFSEEADLRMGSGHALVLPIVLEWPPVSYRTVRRGGVS